MLCTNMMQFNCYKYFLAIQHILCNLDHSVQVCGLMPPKMTLVKKTHITNIGSLSSWLNHYEILCIVMVFGIRLSIFVMLNFIWNKGVCYNVALPFTFKKYLKAKEELWKLKYFTMQKTIIFKKSSQQKKPKSFKIL
jgi:hypothetical protein